MKSRNIGLATALLASLSMQGSSNATMVVKPPFGGTNTKKFSPRITRSRSRMSNTPPKNQRQVRKNARRAFAAGDKFAFSK